MSQNSATVLKSAPQSIAAHCTAHKVAARVVKGKTPTSPPPLKLEPIIATLCSNNPSPKLKRRPYTTILPSTSINFARHTMQPTYCPPIDSVKRNAVYTWCIYAVTCAWCTASRIRPHYPHEPHFAQSSPNCSTKPTESGFEHVPQPLGAATQVAVFAAGPKNRRCTAHVPHRCQPLGAAIEIGGWAVGPLGFWGVSQGCSGLQPLKALGLLIALGLTNDASSKTARKQQTAASIAAASNTAEFYSNRNQ